jgi:hypothetical protein
MDIKGLETLISEIATQQNTYKGAIIDDVVSFLNMKYGTAIMAKERELIDEVKMKIITKLYNAEMHKVNVSSDIRKTFKLDLLEIDYVDNAADELEQEGLLKKQKSNLCLTKEGVMKFKSFYGEI